MVWGFTEQDLGARRPPNHFERADQRIARGNWDGVELATWWVVPPAKVGHPWPEALHSPATGPRITASVATRTTDARVV
jgi:hypothetical protein